MMVIKNHHNVHKICSQAILMISNFKIDLIIFEPYHVISFLDLSDLTQ